MTKGTLSPIRSPTTQPQGSHQVPPDKIMIHDFVAHHTAWGTDDDGTYILMLKDENGEAFACAAYTLEQWHRVFSNLLRAAGEIQ